MYINKIFYWFLLILAMMFIDCKTPVKFQRIQPPKNQTASLYIIRSFQNPLSFWSYNVEIFRYKNHFKNEQTPALLKKIKMSNGDYGVFFLPEGFYKIRIQEFQDSERIIFLSKNSENFLHFYIFAQSYSRADAYLKDLSRENALEYLLEDVHLNKIESSED